VIRRKEKERKIKRKKRSESTKRREELYFFMGKVHIIPSNYYIIVNVSPKLLIVSMPPLNYQKMSMSPNNKNALHKIIKIK
jgi:hypothetical protein